MALLFPNSVSTVQRPEQNVWEWVSEASMIHDGAPSGHVKYPRVMNVYFIINFCLKQLNIKKVNFKQFSLPKIHSLVPFDP